MGLPVTITVLTPGGRPVDLVPLANSSGWSTAAVGGFAAASFDLEGFVRLPYLAPVRITYGPTTIWEGRIEDQSFGTAAGARTTTVRCFGLQRLLSDVSVRRIWSSRSLPLNQRGGLLAQPGLTATTGNFDATDLTKNGVAFFGSGQTSAAGPGGINYRMQPPAGVAITRAMFTYDKAGAASLTALFYSSPDFATYTNHLLSAANVTGSAQNFALVANAVDVLFVADYTAAVATAVADFVKFYNVRILGTSLTEDATGGFYGGTILRDLIGLVPGLSVGAIDAGSDFTIQALERATRAAALSVVEEVASYYTREWAVWEDGRLDWTTRNLDETQNLLRLADLSSLDLTGSVDGIAKTGYVLYSDLVLNAEAEQSVTATDRRNPYVLQGATKDDLTNPGFPMTSTAAAQLATRLIQDRGGWVPASGQLVLPVEKIVQSAVGPARPAALIRAGENVTIADLPKDDLFAPGARDGQTLFHITSAETDLRSGLVTLSIEAQTRQADVLLARLAAVTRTLTG